MGKEKGKLKILIAEDDFVCRTLVQEILSPYGICHIAIDGVEAMEAYKRALDSNDPYGLICLDIMMPNLDGQSVLAQIREIEKERGIGGSDIAKVIMVTALGDAKNIMTALVKGSCEAYLRKPINAEQLVEAVRKLDLID